MTGGSGGAMATGGGPGGGGIFSVSISTEKSGGVWSPITSMSACLPESFSKVVLAIFFVDAAIFFPKSARNDWAEEGGPEEVEAGAAEADAGSEAEAGAEAEAGEEAGAEESIPYKYAITFLIRDSSCPPVLKSVLNILLRVVKSTGSRLSIEILRLVFSFQYIVINLLYNKRENSP